MYIVYMYKYLCYVGKKQLLKNQLYFISICIIKWYIDKNNLLKNRVRLIVYIFVSKYFIIIYLYFFGKKKFWIYLIWYLFIL